MRCDMIEVPRLVTTLSLVVGFIGLFNEKSLVQFFKKMGIAFAALLFLPVIILQVVGPIALFLLVMLSSSFAYIAREHGLRRRRRLPRITRGAERTPLLPQNRENQ